ncbi:unnamed protein product [Diatraea saccharalis]|uniref:C2H2-type domain-containing protein n=1 Tax=Diatraea saccharalis TaxID=40085 RepID=A0A9N9WKQ4_9NEOP|nr:unnamed protein product [Diatraea saccharalis]
MLFKGNSSRLEHLIEKIQANKENHDVITEDIKEALGSVGSTAGSSWPSSTPEPSPSPASTPTSADAADADVEPPFTLGATEHTPYQCQFCDKAFPRLSYLKKHEQSRCVDMHRNRLESRATEPCDVPLRRSYISAPLCFADLTALRLQHAATDLAKIGHYSAYDKDRCVRGRGAVMVRRQIYRTMIALRSRDRPLTAGNRFAITTP